MTLFFYLCYYFHFFNNIYLVKSQHTNCFSGIHGYLVSGTKICQANLDYTDPNGFSETCQEVTISTPLQGEILSELTGIIIYEPSGSTIILSFIDYNTNKSYIGDFSFSNYEMFTLAELTTDTNTKTIGISYGGSNDMYGITDKTDPYRLYEIEFTGPDVTESVTEAIGFGDFGGAITGGMGYDNVYRMMATINNNNQPYVIIEQFTG